MTQFVILLALLIPSAMQAQLSPGDALKFFELGKKDIRIELVAAEPLVTSPCAVVFDERGRLFVAENRGYPNTSDPPQGDIAMLEDTDGDGRMDKRTVFADALTFPNGVMPWRGGLIVTCAPDVLYFKDTDGDGRADERRVLLTGFATTGSTQLRVNAPTLGPDGWIYLAAGLAGGSITCPAHPERPPLKMTSDVRFHPDTLVVENVDGRSQYGMSFDQHGGRFICMNRVPVQHVVLSSKWLAKNAHLEFSSTVQDCSERTVKSGLRGGGDGVRLFPISQNITTADSHAGSFSAACGIMIWRFGSLPAELSHCALTCDPTANLVHADYLGVSDITFTAASLFENRELLASRDDWFRPVFLASGPDGALYVCDMYRKTIEHPDYLPESLRKQTDFESGKTMGRIWRVRDENLKLERAPSFDGNPVSKIIGRMNTHCGWELETAFRLLIEKSPAETSAALRASIESGRNLKVSVQCIRALAAHGSLDDKLLERLLRDDRFGINAEAMKLVAERGPASPALCDAILARAERSQLPFGLLPSLLALGSCEESRAVEILAKLVLRNHGRWAITAAESSAAGREMPLLKAIVDNMDRTVSETDRAPIRNTTSEVAALAGRASPKERKLKDLDAIAHWDLADNASLRPLLLVAFAEAAGIHPYERMDNKALFEWARVVALGNESESASLAAIRLLAKTPWTDAAEPLQRLLASKEQPIRTAAIQALAAFDNDDAFNAVLTREPWSSATPALRETIIAALLSRLANLDRILKALESGVLPVGALNSQRRQLFLKHKDATIRDRAEKLFGAAPAGDRQKAFESAKAVLALPGDAKHGREVFKAQCAICHRLDREGSTVGPDLFDMRNQPKESILFHIVVPDAEIAPAFASYLIELKDARTLTGILIAETPTSLTLRMPLGLEETLPRTNILKLDALPTSLMPTGLESAMNPQDLADLLAFLKGEQ